MENDSNIVLEGNRRTAIYQMFLDRRLVPKAFERIFPYPNTALIKEISAIPVDIVQSREEAMPYLAARHIEGVRQWSSVSKWRISYNYYLEGKSAREIADILMLSPSDTKKYICNYKILERGIKAGKWDNVETKKLTLLSIEPDKLIRIFRTKQATSLLNLIFDEDFNLVSNISFITKERLDKIIIGFTRKAFIDKTLNTRSSINDEHIISFIRKIIPEIKQNGSTLTPGEKQDPIEDQSNQQATQPLEPTSPNTNSNSPHLLQPSSPPPKPSGKQLPYFFEGLDSSHLDPNNQESHGLLQICKEISIFSRKRMVAEFPICGAFLIRGLIEQAFKYYSKSHKNINNNKNIWAEISSGKDPQLKDIIGKYSNRSYAANYISDHNILDYIVDVFSDYKSTASPLNWVIHDPSNYLLTSDKLLSLPKGGLLAIINYLLR
jgi:hypothetical protein